MSPISVSRRTITKCLCRALNVPLSNNTWAPLQLTLQPRTALATKAMWKNHQWEKQRSPEQTAGAGQAWKDQIPVFPALIRAQQYPRGLIKGKLCSALRDPHWGSMELVSDLVRKDTKASSTENGHRGETLRTEGKCSKVCPTETRHKDNFNKHTQMFPESLCRKKNKP